MEGVEQTRGRVLTYFGEDSERYTKGGIVQAFFSASSGGFSLSNRYGFSWEKNQVSQRAVRSWPYLEPVEDHWDVDPDLGNPNASWERSVRASDIARLLRWEEVTDATLVVGESLASPAHVRFEGLDGGESRSATVAGSWLRTHLGLKSSNIMSIDGESPEQSEAPVHPEPPPDPGVPEVPVRNDGDPDDPVWASSGYDPLPLFPDAIDSVHALGIQAILDNRLTLGCGDGTLFCPDDPVSRGAMATFLSRAMRLPGIEGTRFSDVSAGHVHRGAIYAIAELGITSGCGDGTRFCPEDPVTREVMAVFVARARDLPPGVPDGRFTDVPRGHPHSAEIYAIAKEGIALGCADGTRFCPEDPVTRGSMATFLARAFIWRASSPPSPY